MDISWYIHLGKWNHISLSWIWIILRPWMGMIPPKKTWFPGFGRTEGSVVIISPDPWYINPTVGEINQSSPTRGACPRLHWWKNPMFQWRSATWVGYIPHLDTILDFRIWWWWNHNMSDLFMVKIPNIKKKRSPSFLPKSPWIWIQFL